MNEKLSRWSVIIALSMAANAWAAGPAPCDIPKDINTPEWTARCNKAIEREHDLKKRAVLHFGRAYAAIEKYRYDDALIDLDAAVTEDPDCTRCRHERAYLNGELGSYAQAIEDIEREIALSPDNADAYSERAYARKFSGDLAGAYRDRSRIVDLQPDSADALLARAEAAKWVGQFDVTRADAEQARTLAQKQGNTEAEATAKQALEELALWTTTSPGADPASRCVMRNLKTGDPTTLIGDCTQAFLDAPDGATKADALTTRSTAWTVLATSPDNAVVDSRVAAGLDPKNPERYINVGYGFLTSKHSWAANREFERALAIDRHWLALAGRAQARMNLEDPKGAKADALESMKMHPNEAAGWLLADLALAEGNRDVAKKLYLVVYQLGSRDDRLIEQLKQLGVDDPDKAVTDR